MDNWLDVAPLENMEEDHSFLFLKKNLMNIYIYIFFFLNLKNLNISKELKFFIFYFFENLRNLDLLKEFGNFY